MAATGRDIAADAKGEAPGKFYSVEDVRWTSWVSLGVAYEAYIGARTLDGICIESPADIRCAKPPFTLEVETECHVVIEEFHDKVGVHVT